MLILQNQESVESVVNTLMILCASISMVGIFRILLEEYIDEAPFRRRRRQRKSEQYKKLHLTENRVKQRINKG